MRRELVLRRIACTCLVACVAMLGTPQAALGAEEPREQSGDVSAQGGGVFTAFDFAAADHYGSAVAVSADYVAVGAPMEDTNGSAAGCVYVYVRQWANWEWDDTLYASDGAAGAGFGGAVAAYGDTILVGARGVGGYAGAAYVFKRVGDVWVEDEKIVPTGTVAGHNVGVSVALYQDTALIGSWGREQAWAYVPSGSTWVQQGVLSDPAGVDGDFFGYSVALHRDTAVVGADGDGGGTGSAFVFVRSGSTWSLQRKLTPSDPGAGDHFGQAVSVTRDVALIGCPDDDGALADSGSAYIFNRSGTVWTQAQKLHFSTEMANAWFGGAVAICGDAALIGSPGAGTAQGAVSIFTRPSVAWADFGTPWAGVAGDHVGSSVALAGGKIAVGIPDSDEAATDAGAALIAMGEGEHPDGSTRIAGTSRYLTAVEASKHQFSIGTSTVVVATGENWPDALGGSALCGAVYGPMLLTRRASLPTEVRTEIIRLGATRAYVLGGTSAVSTAVENELVGLLGRTDVVRLSGGSRYETARAIANEVIRLEGDFDGHVLVATGGDFPDATAAAPIAAFYRIPIVLANPLTGAVLLPPGTNAASIAGGTSAVSAATEAALDAALGGANVDRIAGGNRYETAALIAQEGIDNGTVDHGMMWEGVGLASGIAFPDALSGGVMLGLSSSVLLLTPPTSLSPYTRAKLEANVAEIDNSLRIIGGTAAVSAATEAAAKTAAGITP